MKTNTSGGKTFETDSEGFLLDIGQWSEQFAEAMAARAGIPHGLTEKHWKVIRFIRDTYKELGKCPLVYQTCKLNGLNLKELKSLFPTGYLRGACRLAGLTYKESYLKSAWLEPGNPEGMTRGGKKSYEVDARGFLVDPYDWDEQYSISKADEMKMPGPLTDAHWKIIYFIRSYYHDKKVIPTVYETCEVNSIELDELERLFPDGYHRGAVKLAGLRVR